MPTATTPVAPRKRRALGTIIFVAVVALIAAFAFSGSWIDTMGQRWVECEVTSAEAVAGTNRAASPWRVEVQTAECGSITYLGVHTEEDSKGFADSMRLGEVYEFKLGVLSRMMLHSPINLFQPSTQEISAV